VPQGLERFRKSGTLSSQGYELAARICDKPSLSWCELSEKKALTPVIYSNARRVARSQVFLGDRQ
jgi:hypothetical protein